VDRAGTVSSDRSNVHRVLPDDPRWRINTLLFEYGKLRHVICPTPADASTDADDDDQAVPTVRQSL
jgi:hypothetical protein